jgi:glutamate racemase
LVLPKIRSLIKQPVIGVVPAIKPAASLCQTPRAALLATPATIKRPYTQNLIDQYAAAIQWIKIGSSRLVELAEQKIYTGKIRIDGVKQEVAPLSVFSAEQLDTVVLGCTHFSLIKDELKQVLPQIQYWVDSAEAIAQRTGFWLHESGFIQQERGASDTPNQLLLTRTTKNTVPGFAPEHTSVLPLS